MNNAGIPCLLHPATYGNTAFWTASAEHRIVKDLWLELIEGKSQEREKKEILPKVNLMMRMHQLLYGVIDETVKERGVFSI